MCYIEHNDAAGRYKEYSRNLATGHWIALCKDESCIETNMVCRANAQLSHQKVDTVGGVTTDTNRKLFDEMEKML